MACIAHSVSLEVLIKKLFEKRNNYFEISNLLTRNLAPFTALNINIPLR